jgi:glycine/D-amino acid oxidase-like deaminating enzyme
MKHHPRAPVAVLGAGLAGVATALELARRGTRVALIEQDERAVNRASLRNEGKIHLGLIYAQDRTLATARLQLEGALSFRSLLHTWIGPRADDLPLSTPFVYLVADTSLLTPDQLEEHYAAVEAVYHERLKHSPHTDYLGARPTHLYERCAPDAMPRHFNTRGLMGAFRTRELAIDTDELALALRDAVDDSDLIDFLPGHKVCSVERVNGTLRIEGEGSEGAWRMDADQVVNALWGNRIAIDRMVGLDCPPGWVHRLKYRVITELPRALYHGPSATMVLGRYGDVVIRDNGTAYLSWYPTGLLGWTHEIAPPESWNAPCRGEVAEEDRRSLTQGILDAIDVWYPGMAQSHPVVVDAGIIVAYGKTDVDDASSALHDRTQIGVNSRDGYHSLDPGKLTTAPLFAKRLAERVLLAEGIPV